MLRERPDQSDGGDEGVGSAESVEDAVLPLGVLVDLVPPIGEERGELHGRGGECEWHSRHIGRELLRGREAQRGSKC